MRQMDPFEERKIEKAVHGALAEYTARGRCPDLEDLEPETVNGLLKVFLDTCHREVHIAPEELDDDALREVLLRWMPRRVGKGRAGSERAVRVVRDYFETDAQGEERKLTASRRTLFEEAESRFPELLRSGEVEKGIAVEPLKAEAAQPGRNDPCPCGSGKKFKKCHALKG